MKGKAGEVLTLWAFACIGASIDVWSSWVWGWMWEARRWKKVLEWKISSEICVLRHSVCGLKLEVHHDHLASSYCICRCEICGFYSSTQNDDLVVSITVTRMVKRFHEKEKVRLHQYCEFSACNRVYSHLFALSLFPPSFPKKSLRSIWRKAPSWSVVSITSPTAASITVTIVPSCRTVS